MENNLPPFIETYRVLVVIPSVSATEEGLDQSNEPLISLPAGWLRDLGFNVEIQPVPGTRHKSNLLVSTGHGAGGLLLTRHADTVLFDDGRWTRDPFTLTEHDNKFYGLDTTGMRDFFAFILDALRDVDVATLKKPPYTLAAAGEETSMASAHYFVGTTQLRPDCVIIGEPTSLQPIRAHKGHMSNTIRIQGQSGHPSDPARGVNAIEPMYDAIGCIMQLHDLSKGYYHFETFTISYPIPNLGAVHGDDASDRTCICCELRMNIRPLLRMALNDLDGLSGEALTPINEHWPGRLTVSELHPSILGYECPPDHRPVQVVEKLPSAQTDVVNYCTEAPFIQTLCPTLVPDPGFIDQAHQPDKHLETRSIRPTRELTSQVAHRLCWH